MNKSTKLGWLYFALAIACFIGAQLMSYVVRDDTQEIILIVLMMGAFILSWLSFDRGERYE